MLNIWCDGEMAGGGKAVQQYYYCTHTHSHTHTHTHTRAQKPKVLQHPANWQLTLKISRLNLKNLSDGWPGVKQWIAFLLNREELHTYCVKRVKLAYSCCHTSWCDFERRKRNMYEPWGFPSTFSFACHTGSGNIQNFNLRKKKKGQLKQMKY